MTDTTDTTDTNITGTVVAVCRNPNPGLPKPTVEAVHLLADLGVEGDYHAGKLVRHRHLAKKYPNRPNVRQVLIVDAATYEELTQQDIHIGPGMMGENVTTQGLAIMSIPVGTRLLLGTAEVEVTEIRKPCAQLNDIDTRLLKAVTHTPDGKKAFRAGIMTRVLKEGWVRPGDAITALPAELEREQAKVLRI